VQVSLFFAIDFVKAACAIRLQRHFLKSKSMQAWLACGVFVFSMSTAQGLWSAAQLSVARENLAATSVGSLALFAGGLKSGCALLRRWREGCSCLFRTCFLCLACVVLWLSLCLPWGMQMCSHARLCS
jgi:hypothetical protein